MRGFRMSRLIGIDIGGSTTKIVGYKNGGMFSPMLVRATDPLASVYGAFGKFLSVNSLHIGDVDRVMITGVGGSFVTDRLFGLPTGKVDEFRAIGMGGLKLSGLDRAIIVSMGTGTAFVKMEKGTAVHLGGTGVGGGTLLGLSNRMLNVRNFDDLVEMANGGDLANVDLTIGDITREQLVGLPPETTASNFGNISDLAARPDIALGIINLVFQTIGMIAVFAARADNIGDVVLTGNLTNVPQGMDVFNSLSTLVKVAFHQPPHAEYATAVGAALVYDQAGEFMEIGSD
jgi:type II pantothenate kinase